MISSFFMVALLNLYTKIGLTFNALVLKADFYLQPYFSNKQGCLEIKWWVGNPNLFIINSKEKWTTPYWCFAHLYKSYSLHIAILPKKKKRRFTINTPLKNFWVSTSFYTFAHTKLVLCVAQKEYFMLSTLNSTFAFRKTKTLFHGHVLCFNKYCLLSLFHSSYLTTILSNVQAIVCEFLIGKVTDLRILTICLETCGMLV